MSLVSRPYYLDFLRRHKDRPVIKVVSGIRRCGKSTLFKLFQDELLADNVIAEQIIDINFELMEYDKLRDYRALYEYINEWIIPSKKCILNFYSLWMSSINLIIIMEFSNVMY